MKNKHIQNYKDTELLMKIHQAVNNNLEINKTKTRRLICIKFVFYFSLIVFFYLGILTLKNSSLFILSYILFGFTAVLFAFNFAHDFSHDTIFRKKQWNNLGYTMIYTMVGAHAEAWKHRHIHSHHFAPNVDGHDTDLKISSLIRVVPASKYYWYNRFQHIYALFAYTTYSLFWVFIKDFYVLFSKDSRAKNNRLTYYLSFLLQKTCYVLYILIIPAFYTEHSLTLVLISFLLMHLFQSIFLLLTFFITHHVESTAYPTINEDGLINSSWLMNQIKSSNDFYPFSKTANFIFGGFNNHIAHHLFPNMHHVYYPKISQILYQTLNSYQITPNQSCYFTGVLSHLKVLKRMSR